MLINPIGTPFPANGRGRGEGERTTGYVSALRITFYFLLPLCVLRALCGESPYVASARCLLAADTAAP